MLFLKILVGIIVFDIVYVLFMHFCARNREYSPFLGDEIFDTIDDSKLNESKENQ